VRGRRSYAEALWLSSHSEEECFNSYTELIARVPRWLIEASAKMGLQAQGVGKCVMVLMVNLAPAKTSDEQRLISMKSHSLLWRVRGSVETGGCAVKVGGDTGEVPVSRNQLLVELYSGKKAMNIGPGQLKGPEGKVNQAALSAINVNQELRFFRESLKNLKGEVDIGLARLDWVIKNLEGIGPGQGCRSSRAQNVVSPKGKEKWIKPKRKLLFKLVVGVGSGARSKAVKPSYSKGLKKAQGWQVLCCA
jgi:hypothetical protein